MQYSDLSAEEITLVQRHRDEKAKEANARAFKSAALATAKAFDEWSAASGELLTFSTFINSFGYDGSYGELMFKAVSRINEAALPSA